MAKKDSQTPLKPNEVTLGDIRSAYYEATGKASDIARQLCFAGIALLWLLSGVKVETGQALHIPHDLLWPGLSLIVALALDLLQYAWRSAAWGIYGRLLEKKGTSHVSAKPWLNTVALIFFWGKLIAVALAYAQIGAAVIARLG